MVASDRSASLYRSVWRWHFYAGLLVLPFLGWLAITGGLYLYKAEIERLVYADWVAIGPGAPLPAGVLVRRVTAQTGASVTQIARPAAPGESWRMTVLQDGERRTAFVDPRSGRVPGTTSAGGIMATVRSLHSLAITGPIGNALIEIVAGWTILLVATGVYLWWPRGHSPGLALRGTPKRRLFWRDLHASTGIVAGTLILFLALTGMPWSGVWGQALGRIVAAQDIGRPQAPVPSEHHALPWSLDHAAVPASSGSGDVGVDRVLAIAARRGIGAPWTLSLPAAPGAPYLVSPVARQAGDARALYVDAGTGHVLQDARYARFGAGARAIEWGIAAHEGRQYGEPNRLVMLGGCIAILLLVISAPVMWWKRRPSRGLGAPPAPANRARGLVGLMLAAGIVFPLTGLTMLVALAGQRVVRGRVRNSSP
ncbi:PepSY-associated TM helix domain-containing protein [Sphingomonas qomolangmaensis]|uniref:PepSY domain-containing protein n=1 Tax=Sphingomonas qomolangmaensis TaxID=2918765 RepID=A0ABY5L8M4_9SPHN|nr:PepSY domain-containing protein [Sphingomonas qomolangmaensis]UUL82159.1 PepSY domain-containing protein [Sphingomonas qomolangmaensis]